MLAHEKTNPLEYAPVSDEESYEGGDEEDGLISIGLRPVTSRMKRFWAYLACLTFVAFYSILIIGATSAYWHNLRLRGPGVIESPLDPFIQYEQKFFPKMNIVKDRLMGPPSPAVDAKWQELTQFFFSEYPSDAIKKLGRENEAIKLPNGNFIVLYTVNHLLHCLKRLHQSRYPDHYFPNMTETERIHAEKHDMHCLEDLVQHVTCHADVSPYTTVWYQNELRPTGNPDIAHTCVNWDMLKSELKRTHVDPWEPGVLVHPIYGPVVTNGKDTAFERMGYPDDFLLLGETKEQYKNRVHKDYDHDSPP